MDKNGKKSSSLIVDFFKSCVNVSLGILNGLLSKSKPNSNIISIPISPNVKPLIDHYVELSAKEYRTFNQGKLPENFREMAMMDALIMGITAASTGKVHKLKSIQNTVEKKKKKLEGDDINKVW